MHIQNRVKLNKYIANSNNLKTKDITLTHNYHYMTIY